MKKENLTLVEKERTELSKKENRIISAAVVLAVLLFGFGIEWGIGGLIFVFWSCLWYEKGKYFNVTDEYEAGGYPQDGLRWMYNSWKFLAVAVIIYLMFFK